jgi:hypothetical protein
MMNKLQYQIRDVFVTFLIVLFLLYWIAGVFLPVYVGGKQTPRDRAMRICRNYLEYAKFASTNGEFKSDFSKFSEFEKNNQYRTIFNTNQNFWAKTNFVVSALNPEPVIVCKQQFYYPRSKNSFGCSYSRPKPAFVIGYSDGTAALISQEQFTNLNWSNFVPLSSLGGQFPITWLPEVTAKIQIRPEDVPLENTQTNSPAK